MAFQNGWRGPDIVADGLVLYLDAGSPNSYRLDFGTTWKDMSGFNNSGSLINGPTYSTINGGSFVFNGNSEYVLANLNCNKTNYSIDWWIYPSTVSSFNQFMTFNSLNWGSFGCHTTSAGQVYIGTTDIDGTGRIAPWRTNVYVTNTWQNFTWTFANGAAKFYKNSTLEASGTISVAAAASFTSLYIGRNDTNTINGRIPNIKVYSNKVLSTDEIAQNYNAVKSRFGL
jgi:hypothetical protein